MYVVTVTFTLVPESFESFIKLAQENADIAKDDPGCLQFDVCWNDKDKQVFFYALYGSEEEFNECLQNEHSVIFDQKTEPMVTEKQSKIFSNIHMA
ncbi:antibiotic biosynthesis monooxygenase family protein [Vibrio ruber]|uniref:Antibiotic biosynthesis monooxygenase n=1 Tax=Vibrio ruber (strain DSM 16370 / JCM 11486 / BCRC 17186 / CECT 7878 / LMG 23124 / VR1) TaxID=1123498 RepID=A0A1R4LN69_VIBR1|nr:antibiotic biosynthesis monooxygenase family protein [Vibrio ruber]WNJ95924.1 antibiotic biosynthesis monooxygenase family protein [Vibrio ruber]SJN58046.1 Antibiotic biosynthesis monooxygenase [Vibrio ruber DSM 16370]